MRLPQTDNLCDSRKTIRQSPLFQWNYIPAWTTAPGATRTRHHQPLLNLKTSYKMNLHTETPSATTREQLTKGLGKTAFAFRGYNATNLGRTPELLRHPQYGPIVARYLQRASDICTDVMKFPVDLAQRVRRENEATLKEYHESIALIVAVELAQLEILETFFEISLTNANMMYGFSLGELTALSAGGVLTLDYALKIPLMMSRDAA